MTRILLLSMLLTMVYSWEEMKRAVRVLFYRLIIKKRPLFGPQGAIRIDEAVSTAVVFAAIPLSLTYLLVSSNPFRALGVLALVLVGASAVAYASAVAMRRFNPLPAGFALAAIAMPALGNLAILPRKLLSRFSLYLALPPAVGLALRFAVNNYGAPAEFLPNLDILILVLVGALFAQIAAEFVGRHLRAFRRFKLFSYYRVALGVVLAAILLMGR